MRLLFEDTVQLPTDAVECISLSEKKSLFLAASYKLQDAAEQCAPQRTGGIQAYRVSTPDIHAISVEKLPFVACDFGILDFKQVNVTAADDANRWLISANSNNSGTLWKIENANSDDDFAICQASKLASSQIKETVSDAPLFLAVETDEFQQRAFFSTSAGELCVFDVETQSTLNRFTCHTHEAWTCAADTESIVYTGADDALIKGWDVRCAEPAALHTIKWHEAGVCSLRMNHDNRHYFVSGAYDNSVALWDKRSLRRPVCNGNLGGGVWRVRWATHSQNPNRLWAACMYAGFRAFDISVEGFNLREVSNSAFTAPTNSIAYGLSVHPTLPLLGTCTFYDACFKLWHCY